MCSSVEFAELAGWCRDLVDRLAASLPEDMLGRMEDAFLTSSRYELLFWGDGVAAGALARLRRP